MLGFEERGKPEYPEKTLLEQRREPTTNSTHIWHRRWDLNLGHTGGRWALSPLRHPCSLNKVTNKKLNINNHLIVGINVCYLRTWRKPLRPGQKQTTNSTHVQLYGIAFGIWTWAMFGSQVLPPLQNAYFWILSKIIVIHLLLLRSSVCLVIFDL